MRPIDLPPAGLDTVRRILRDHAPGLEARAFGSRVSWTARETSDLDLVLMTESPLDAGRMAALRAAFSGSDLPFRVDVADWAAVSEDFRAIIEREYVVLRRKTPAGPTRKTGRQIRRFGDCAELVRNAVSPASMKDTPYIGLEHIGEGTLSILGRGTIRDVNSPKYEFRSGDILFGRLRPYFRKVVRPNFDGVCSTDIWVVRARKNIDRIFLYYTMANPLFVDFATNASEGTRMPRAKWDWVSRYEVRLPSLAEQRAIAEILGALDDKIELNRRMNETLEAMARAIFDDWFVDFGPTRAKMEGREPYLAPEIWRLFPDRLVDTELGQIPHGWNSTVFGDVADMTSGRSYKSSELAESEAALVTLKSFSRNGGYQPDGLKPYTGKFKAGQIIRQGEVVVACTDITQDADVIGRPAVVHPSSMYKTLIASLDMVIVRPTAKIGRGFLYFLCSSHAFTHHTLSYTTGTTVLHLDKKAIPMFKFACPPSSLLDKFGEIAEDAIDRVVANSVENETLAMLRDLLLPRLMSGQLRLGDAEKAAA